MKERIERPADGSVSVCVITELVRRAEMEADKGCHAINSGLLVTHAGMFGIPVPARAPATQSQALWRGNLPAPF